MAGLPFIKWFSGDWSRDHTVAALSLAGRGFWFELLQAMHNARVGRLSGTVEALARTARCTPDEASACITELQSTRAADVRRHTDGTVTVSSRRLAREEIARNKARNRQKEKRSRDCHALVPEMFPLISDSDVPRLSSSVGGVGEGDIARVYAAYPRKSGKAAALKAIGKAVGTIADVKGIPKPDAAEWLLGQVQAYAASAYVRSQNPDLIPYPATWMNAGHFDDDPAEWQRSVSNGRYSGPASRTSRPTAAQAAADRREAQRGRECPEPPIRLPVQ